MQINLRRINTVLIIRVESRSRKKIIISYADNYIVWTRLLNSLFEDHESMKPCLAEKQAN